MWRVWGVGPTRIRALVDAIPVPVIAAEIAAVFGDNPPPADWWVVALEEEEEELDSLTRHDPAVILWESLDEVSS
jgi:hypothetical protein